MGTGLLFAEKEHFDDEQEARAIRKTQCENTRKRKAADLLEARNNKRRTVALSELPANVPPSAPSSQVVNDEDYDIELDDTIIQSVNSLQELKDVMANTHHVARAKKRKKRELDPGAALVVRFDLVYMVVAIFDIDTFDGNYQSRTLTYRAGTYRSWLRPSS